MRLLSRPQWALYQYHVDFKPPLESRRVRSGLLYDHEELLGKTMTFDGTMLFLPHRLHNTVNGYMQTKEYAMFYQPRLAFKNYTKFLSNGYH